MRNNTDMKEISYAQKLAHVENSVRLKALRKLQRFINCKSSIEAFTLDDLMKIWKGLYYCMYMADKPLVQENLAEDIAKLIEEFQNSSQMFLFIEAAFETFSREWNGIDKFRMDKFMMLFTRFLRQSLAYLKRNKWNMDEVGKLIRLMENIIICPSDTTNSKPLGLKMHLTDILLDELAKVGRENLPNDVTITFLYPFFKVLVVCRQGVFVKYVVSKIFVALVRMSDLGIQNQDDLAIGEIEVVREDEDNEENEEIIVEEEPLDPRAGGIDVYIPQVKPNYAQIADILLSLGGIADISQYKRNLLYKYVNIFLDLEMGVYPYRKIKGKFETSGQNFKSDTGNKKDYEGSIEAEKESADVNSYRKLKLGDYGSSIKKNRKFWNRLQKKSDEEKQKEVRKGNFNSEFVVNKVFLKLAVGNKIPNNFYVTSGPLHNIKTKKRKNQNKKQTVLSEVSSNLTKPDHLGGENKNVSLANNAIPSLPQQKKQPFEKKQKIKGKKNDIIKSSNNMTKINLISEKFDDEKANKANLTINKQGKFKSKNVKQSNVNPNASESSLTLATLSDNVRKSSVEKKRKRKIKLSKNANINKTVNENAKKCSNKVQNFQNPELNKISTKFDEEKSNNKIKINNKGNKKGKLETKNVNQSKVNGGSQNESSFTSNGIKEQSVVAKERKIRKISDNFGFPNLKKRKKECNNSMQVPEHQKMDNINSSSLPNFTVSKNGKLEAKNTPNASPVSVKDAPGNLTIKKGSSSMNMVIKTQNVNTKGKLLKINLRQNTVHDVMHYRKILNSSPGIPFSANKRPQASVLKSTPPTNSRKKLKKLKRLQEFARML